MKTVICTRNESKSLNFSVNGVYKAEELPGGMYRIYKEGEQSWRIIAPLDGHYLQFKLVP